MTRRTEARIDAFLHGTSRSTGPGALRADADRTWPRRRESSTRGRTGRPRSDTRPLGTRATVGPRPSSCSRSGERRTPGRPTPSPTSWRT